MPSYAPLGGNVPTAHLDTAYNPPSQGHRRSQSAAAMDRTRDFGDDISLLEKEKHDMEELYDPISRSGRPSFTHSAPSSPTMGPRIMVSSPNPSVMHLPATSTEIRGGQYPRSYHGPSSWAKFLARFRLVLIILTLIVSALVVACNANTLSVYYARRNTGAWIERGAQKVWWPAWPQGGIDLRPIRAYLSLGVLNTIVTLLFFGFSANKNFRYLQTGFCRAFLVIIVCSALMVLWILIDVFLQFQATGSSGMHSFKTWTCTHTDKNLYAVDGINYSQLCTEANISRYSGIAEAVLNLLIVLTVIFSACAGRRSRSYEKYPKSASWMPKWGRQ